MIKNLYIFSAMAICSAYLASCTPSFPPYASVDAVKEWKELGPADWPLSCEAARDRAIKEFSEEALEEIYDSDEEELPNLQRTLGMKIRNRYAMWSGNASLMQSCTSTNDPDKSSLQVLRLIREKLHNFEE